MYSSRCADVRDNLEMRGGEGGRFAAASPRLGRGFVYAGRGGGGRVGSTHFASVRCVRAANFGVRRPEGRWGPLWIAIASSISQI